MQQMHEINLLIGIFYCIQFELQKFKPFTNYNASRILAPMAHYASLTFLLKVTFKNKSKDF
jgi:hypothetical protein